MIGESQDKATGATVPQTVPELQTEESISRFTTWISEWIETLRIAPPFSRRRRDIIEATRDHDDPDAWVEVERPRGGVSS